MYLSLMAVDVRRSETIVEHWQDQSSREKAVSRVGAAGELYVSLGSKAVKIYAKGQWQTATDPDLAAGQYRVAGVQDEQTS